MNRNRLVGGALGLVVAAGAIGWIAGAQITSPAEAAARAEAPEPSLITVDVDRRLLSADIVARGTIDYDDPVQLGLSGSFASDTTSSIVTMALEAGTDVTEGDVVLEVANRPVFVLSGELPVYRDLRPGSSGDDVEQLELALQRLGLLDRADDTWDDATGAAVQALYAAQGYRANAASDADQDALDAARDQVRAASQALADAQDALEDAGGASGSALIAARNALADAQGARTVATTERTAAIAAANAAVTVAAQALADAEADEVLAQARLDAANGGTHPDTGTTPTALELAELNADLTAAQLAVTERAGEHADAQQQVLVVTAQQDAAVDAAARQVTLAQAQLTEAQSPGDTTMLVRSRDDARRAVTDATASLRELESTVGTWIPAGELIFVKRLPVQAIDVSVERGDTVSGAFMTVSSANVAMIISLEQSEAARLEVGDTVIIDEPDLLDEPMELQIAQIPQAGSSDRVQVVVLFDEVPQMLLGANVRVVIPVESTSGEVLVVPAAALSAVANGDTRVEVEDPANPGETRFVTVVTGLATDGVVEVRAVDGELSEGDRVVVGQAAIAGGDESDDESDPDAEPTDDEG